MDFPVYDLPETTNETEAEPALKDLYNLLASIRKPQDINAAHFRAFNLSVESNVPASQIACHDDANTVPPLAWEIEQQQEGDNGQSARTSNGYPYPDKKRFEVLKNELLLGNDDVFREVTRMSPREGRQRVRVTQTRKFWTGLERMAQYWDTSLDNYFERAATSEEQEHGNGQADAMQTDDNGKQDQQDHLPTAQANGNASHAPGSQSPPIVTRYTGRRTGAGHEMPEDMREETVRAFIEMGAWPFGCQVTVPTLPPRLTVKALLFPVRLSLEAARSPQDRMLARSGVLEGPVLVAQCRPETAFRTPQETLGSGIGEICDLYREVGAMLLGAQERARHGTTEVRPGEGKWWTTEPRWGGGEGGPAEREEEGKTDSSDNANDERESHCEQKKACKRSKYDHPYLATRRQGRKMSNAEKWKMVQPGASLWDRRMRYQRIGKSSDSLFDDVCPVTSILFFI